MMWWVCIVLWANAVAGVVRCHMSRTPDNERERPPSRDYEPGMFHTCRRGKILRFTYRNSKGEIARRKVSVVCIWYGSTEYHPKEQWLMRALDLDKNEERDFAMEDITNLREV